MALAERTKTTYAVRDSTGTAVVLFWGDPELVDHEIACWAERTGYTVAPVAPDELA